MEQQTINQRLNTLVDKFEGGKKAAFARKVGISSQGAQELLAGRKGAPSFKVLSQILEQYPSVDANWLVLGRGSMLHEQPTPSTEKVENSAEATSGVTVSIDGQTYMLAPEQWELIEKSLLEMTAEKAKAQVEASWMARTYHFDDDPTPGLEYDDRISSRLNFNKKEIKEWMASPDFDRLPHTKIGNRIIVTERGVREFVGDLPRLK